MAEVDVTLTADDRVVCLHDEKLARTTNGRGRISDVTLEEAQRLDAGSWFSPAFAGERIPTLETVLETARARILLNIEVKPSTVDRGVAAKVVDLVHEHRMGEEVVISSFSPEALAQVHALDPELHTVSLFNRKLHRGVDPATIIGEVGSVAFNINRHYLNREIMDRCQELSIPVGVYTANKRRQMERLVDRGVHSIFTNHPDLLAETLAARQRYQEKQPQ
jgi:glycerophosphoryl diester phosphodiesterase